MRRIEDEVDFLGHDYAWHGEGQAAATTQPVVAVRAGYCDIGQIVHQRVRDDFDVLLCDLDAYQGKVRQGLGQIEVHERFQKT